MRLELYIEGQWHGLFFSWDDIFRELQHFGHYIWTITHRPNGYTWVLADKP